MSTKDRLAEELERAGCPPEMVKKAREGFYDDFESPLPLPLVVLVDDLRNLNRHELAERAMDGEFDGTREEANAWMRTEGQELLKHLTKREKP